MGVVGLQQSVRVTAGMVIAVADWLDADRAAARANAAAPSTAAAQVLADEEFTASLRSEKFWSGRKSGGGASPSSLGNSRSSLGAASAAKPSSSGKGRSEESESSSNDDGSRWYSGGGNTYRTMCVRLCDGFYWPVSFSVADDSFERDSDSCERSCSSPARLFIYKNPGGSLETMEDLKGRAYTRLKTAFLFRTNYDAACTCRAQPWEKEAQDRHRVYALDAASRKGDSEAARKLKELRLELIAQSKAGDQKGEARRAAELWLPESASEKASASKSKPQKTAARQSRSASDSSDVESSEPPMPQRAGNDRSATNRPPAVASAPPPTVMRLGAGVPTSAGLGPGRRSSQGDDWKRQILIAK